METALYHPEHGYYTRWRRGPAGNPFGREGDFYTAAQLQPVFGRLISSLARAAGSKVLLDWGAGREDLRAGVEEIPYVAVDSESAPPSVQEGPFVFANELFDALPVDVAVRQQGQWRQRCVDWREGSFRWVDGPPLEERWQEYAARCEPGLAEQAENPLLELPVRMEEVLDRISAAAPRGELLVIDYGYTLRELIRFPAGTLMSYRRHQASEDVLRSPGGQDITAHVPWFHLEEQAERRGWRIRRSDSLASLLLHAGEKDQFSSALRAECEGAAARLRLQLKTLLVGMGEAFQCRWWTR
jgi:SAM-dependent MidA family methyltransferase